MKRCAWCKKRTRLLEIECKWCKSEFCISCLPIEIHICPETHECKSAKQELLSETLNKNKTESNGNYIKI